MKTDFFWLIFFIIVEVSHTRTGKPQKPTNISCKIIDFIKMVCTWDPLHSSHRTHWNLSYGINHNGTCWFIKHLKLHRHRHREKMVIWDQNSDSPYRRYVQTCIKIIGKSKTGIIESNIIKFTPDYIVELNPVKITNIQTTDTSIYITWEHPLIQRPTVCSVRYAPVHHPLNFQTKWNKTNNIHLTKLSPSTWYNIWIHWKLNASIFWSKEKGLNVTTNHASLKSGPVIIKESYLKHKCIRSNQTCVSIYWKPIQGSLAKTEFYEISYCMHHESINHNITIHAERRSLMMKYPYFPLKFICIRAKTDIGYSPYSTFILNQYSSASPKVKKVTVEETNDPQTLSVTWSYETEEWNHQMEPVTNVTLLWCRGQKILTDVLVVSCQGQLDWITVIANENYLLKRNKTFDINYFHVAVILNTKTGIQGITWSECIFTQTGYINDLTIPLFITTLSGNIFVQWYPVGCKITIIPLMYQVAYTRKTTKYQWDPCESGSIVNVSISQTKIELTNFEANQLYYICIRLMTVIGPTRFSKPHLVNSSSPLTNERTRTSYTQREHKVSGTEGIPQIILYVAGIFVGILLCISVFRCLWKSCHLKIKIQFPEIITDEERENEKK